jgi:hypothetical protein
MFRPGHALKLAGRHSTRKGTGVDTKAMGLTASAHMSSELIHPRSPRETMDGWSYLPRYIDKVRLHLAGRLHPDYQANFGKGFDGWWLEAAGVSHVDLIEVVRTSITDGQVCDWVRANVKKTADEKQAHAERLLNHPPATATEAVARLKMRMEQSGLGHRTDVKTFVDYIDADEKRI